LTEYDPAGKWEGLEFGRWTGSSRASSASSNYETASANAASPRPSSWQLSTSSTAALSGNQGNLFLL